MSYCHVICLEMNNSSQKFGIICKVSVLFLSHGIVQKSDPWSCENWWSGLHQPNHITVLKKLSMLGAACQVKSMGHITDTYTIMKATNPQPLGSLLYKNMHVLCCMQNQLFICRYSCTMTCPASKTFDCWYHRKTLPWLRMWKQTWDY